jgi:pimeloyl-ACP methyl ester carboxylesterase
MAFEPSEADAHAAIPALEANPPRILVLAGSEDPASVAAADVLRKRLQASCQILPQAGHALPWTRPDEVARAIDSFFQEPRT